MNSLTAPCAPKGDFFGPYQSLASRAAIAIWANQDGAAVDGFAVRPRSITVGPLVMRVLFAHSCVPSILRVTTLFWPETHRPPRIKDYTPVSKKQEN